MDGTSVPLDLHPRAESLLPDTLELTQDARPCISTPELKKWPLGERIGQGAFGDAFLVSDPKSKKKFVLKRIRMARQNEWQRTATRQEIKLGCMLQHPYIVRFMKSWIRDGHEVSIVYGYCEQGDLQTVMRKLKGKFIEEKQLRRWLAQLLIALHYMQSKHVLHRDLKSSNIFLTAENDVQIGDFGLATIRDTLDSSNHDQSIVGTPHFMSPEVLNRKCYDYKTDIWSLGCVVYELTALRSPFNAFNLNGLVSKICKAAVAPLPTQYSEEWGSIIKWMLKKSATKRPSVEEMLACEALRRDVVWACERARQLFPDVELPPLPTPAPLLRQVSSGCFGAAAAPVASGATDGSDGGAGEDSASMRTPPPPPPRAQQASSGGGAVAAATTPTSAPAAAPEADTGARDMRAPAAAPAQAPAAGTKRARRNSAVVMGSAATAVGGAAAALQRQAQQPVTKQQRGALAAPPCEGGEAAAAAPGGGVPRGRVTARIMRTGAARGVPPLAVPGASKPLTPLPDAAGPAAPTQPLALPVDSDAGAASGALMAGAEEAASAMEVDVSEPPSKRANSSPTGPSLAAAASAATAAAPAFPRALPGAAGVAKPAEGGQAPAAARTRKAPLPSWRPTSQAKAGGAGGERKAGAAPVFAAAAASTAAAPAAAPRYRDVAKAVSAAAAAAKQPEEEGKAEAAAEGEQGGGQDGFQVEIERHSAPARGSSSSGGGSSIARAASQQPPVGAGPTAMRRGPANILRAAPVAKMTAAAAAGVAAAGAPPHRARRNSSSSGERATVTAAAAATVGADGAAAGPAPAGRRGVSAAAPAVGFGFGRAKGRERPGAPAAPVNHRGGAAAVAASAAAVTACPARSTASASHQQDGSPSRSSAAALSPPLAASSPVPQQPSPSRPPQPACVSGSGQALCVEFSLGGLPAEGFAAPQRSNSCSSLPGGSPSKAEARAWERGKSMSGASTGSTPVGGQRPHRLAAHTSAAVPAMSDAGDEAVSREQRDSQSQSPFSGLEQQHQQYDNALGRHTFDNQLFQSPNSRKGSGVGLSGAGGGGGGAAGRSGGNSSCAAARKMGFDIDGFATVTQVRLNPDDGIGGHGGEGWRDGLGCAFSFADMHLEAAGDSRPGVISMGDAAAPAQEALLPQQAQQQQQQLRFGGARAGSAFAGFGAAAAAPGQAGAGESLTPPFVAGGRAVDPMSVSEVAASSSPSGLTSVARRLQLNPAAADASDDEGGDVSEALHPGSLGKWMGGATATANSGGGRLVGFASPAPTAAAVHQLQQRPAYAPAVAATASPLHCASSPSLRRTRSAAPSAAAAAAAAVPVGPAQGEGWSGSESVSAERMLALERIVGLATRLHALGRWAELGTVLSSAQLLQPPVGPAPAEVEAEVAAVAAAAAAAAAGAWVGSPPGGGAAAAERRTLSVGDKVIVGSRKGVATIRYLGPCHWAAGDFVGLELDRAEGKHDGVVDGIVYFKNCPPAHGIFVKSSMLKPARA